MATVTAVRTEHPGTSYLHTWSNLTTANQDGSAVSIPGAADRTIHCIGTLGVGGAVTMQGSNDGTNWATLTDFQDADVIFTAVDTIKILAEAPLYIRPLNTAGDGSTDMSILMFSRGSK
jgi:hypothetical protein